MLSLTLHGQHNALSVGLSARLLSRKDLLRLDELQEGALQRRAQRLDLLVELDRADSTLRDTLRGEFEFLQMTNVSDQTSQLKWLTILTL